MKFRGLGLATRLQRRPFQCSITVPKIGREARAGDTAVRASYDELRYRHLDLAGRSTVGKVKDAEDELHRVVRRAVEMIDADVYRIRAGVEAPRVVPGRT